MTRRSRPSAGRWTRTPAIPRLYRAIAAITWLNLMFSRGALSADEFLSSLPESNVAMKAPPADMEATFRTNVQKAISLAEAQVREHPRDADAHINLGAARGLLAAYTVTIEGSLFEAVGLARSAFKVIENVLTLDPSRKDASFFAGSYRYAVANLSAVKRWLAYLAGFGGDRERAIRLLEESAAYPSDIQADAKVLLVLVYNKERRYDDALRLLEGLRRDFPRNRLLWLESGATDMRAGRPARALEFLDAGIAMFERDTRQKAFGEAALWYAKRGAAHAALGDRAEGRNRPQEGAGRRGTRLGPRPLPPRTRQTRRPVGKQDSRPGRVPACRGALRRGPRPGRPGRGRTPPEAAVLRNKRRPGPSVRVACV